MKTKTVFFCTECGNEFPRWLGQCTACGSWNTIVEQEAAPKSKTGVKTQAALSRRTAPQRISEISYEDEIRFETGLGELDRVLGGGAVKGSLVLVGGAPGVGKSTLLLQICGHLTKFAKVLYVSGEESARQIKIRADRLEVGGDNLYIVAETSLHNVMDITEELKPDILIIDSIQTLYNEALDSSPGSVGQVKDCTLALMQLAKGEGITVFIVGHVNKEGAIAGPRVLEHMVDCVLYFGGDRSINYRILRAAKNRFGSTNEIGVFEMLDAGLSEVPNPSEMLLSGRPENTPGTCVACVMEGTRPILAEIQALVTPTAFNVPRRNSNGIDYNRAVLLMAVLEKRGGLQIGACDAYINVIGGLSLDEPASDLATVLAIASSYLDKPIDAGMAAIGEVGLTGEIRSVTSINQRLSEIRRLGFTSCIVPDHSKANITVPAGLKIIPVKSIRTAISCALRV
ncbi:MAG TPA: DNA repair protein RadA [Clostridiales bacterium]|jgi:DNA repair protein RadA/Sms|nr:DNA repair protein RadA [Clostridiales bacterium]